jgi:hypothetical protein
MKAKSLLLVLLLFVVFKTFGQITFEKGYIITNDNKKIDCLIKNLDWRNNPTEFSYKLAETDSVRLGTLKTIKGFGVDGYSSYVRALTQIDRSSNLTEKLSKDKNPNWTKETLFLKVLVSGSAKLYQYNYSELEKYFYSKSDTAISQLVYKKYVEVQDGQDIGIAENNKFRGQLWSYVKCPTANMNSVKDIKYTQIDLEKYFKNYNKCVGDTIAVSNIQSTYKKDFFNLKITPGINYSSLIVTWANVFTNTKVDFGSNINFRLGLELELILPFYKNKLGLLLEPTIQYFNSEITFHDQSSSYKGVIKYKSLKFPVGFRYYAFLNNNTKLFLNGFISYPVFKMKSQIDLQFEKLDVDEGMTFVFGGGINYKKFSGEIRFSKNDLLDSNREVRDWSSEFKNISFIVGYKISEKKR